MKFVTWRSMGMYSSAYVEPSTKEIFLSGDLVNNTSSDALHDSGLVWYVKQKDAEKAAVARCLDCTELREGRLSPRRPFGVRVKEPPYKFGKGLPFPIAIPKRVRSQLGIEVELRDTIDNTTTSGLSSGDNNISTITQFPNLASTAPKDYGDGRHPTSVLTEFYLTDALYREKVGLVVLTKKNFVTWFDGKVKLTRKFTGAFVCPVSGEIFLSGRCIRWQDESYSTLNGLQWYPSKKKAEAAAAAVAHDCFCFRKQLLLLSANDDDRPSSEFRFCVEAPYREGGQSEEYFIESIPVEHREKIKNLQRVARKYRIKLLSNDTTT